MSRVASGQSIRVGSQIYQINITPAQLEKRNTDKQRERRISRETSKRRKALEERRKQTQLREEKERQTELLKRREKQREATERYQRAHIPVPARRRFSSPILKSPLYQSTLRKTNETQINEIRGYYSSAQLENEEHSRRTAQKQYDFNQKLKEQLRPVPPPPYQHYPSPPSYPKPQMEVKSAWSGGEDPRAPSRCDRRPSDEYESNEMEDLEATFTVEHRVEERGNSKSPETVKRASTPEAEIQHSRPSPPQDPKPQVVQERKDPRIKKIEVLNMPREISNGQIWKEKISDRTPDVQIIKPEVPEREAENEVEEADIKQPKGILKARTYNRRVVSAGKNGGIVAASIRDSLELATRPIESKKSVKWDKLYYNDQSVAEFGVDGKPVHIPQTKKKGRGNKSNSKKESTKTTKGKKGAKQAAELETKPKTMSTRNSQYSIVPNPSAGPRTEVPLIKPEYEMIPTHDSSFYESSRVPMPPTVPRPLTSRTQVIRSRRKLVSGPVRVKTYKTNNVNDPQMILNSNNQVNIHIGSLEINEKLDKTPTDQEINWLWDRVRSALEAQNGISHANPAKRPKTAPKSSRTPVFSKSARPTSASAVNSSSSNFILAEQMARRGVPDERIMGVIEQTPMTQLSLEEQQIQQSLMRLDNRLLNIQGNVTNNQSARDLQFQIGSMFQR